MSNSFHRRRKSDKVEEPSSSVSLGTSSGALGDISSSLSSSTSPSSSPPLIGVPSSPSIGNIHHFDQQQLQQQQQQQQQAQHQSSTSPVVMSSFEERGGSSANNNNRSSNNNNNNTSEASKNFAFVPSSPVAGGGGVGVGVGGFEASIDNNNINNNNNNNSGGGGGGGAGASEATCAVITSSGILPLFKNKFLCVAVTLFITLIFFLLLLGERTQEGYQDSFGAQQELKELGIDMSSSSSSSSSPHSASSSSFPFPLKDTSASALLQRQKNRNLPGLDCKKGALNEDPLHPYCRQMDEKVCTRPEYFQQIRKNKRACDYYDTTVVSAFYPMKSKRPTSIYQEYMKLFFSVTGMPVVVFCDPSTETYINSLLGNNNNLQQQQEQQQEGESATSEGGVGGGKEQNHDDVVVIAKPFSSWAMSTERMHQIWTETSPKDPNLAIHSNDLYAVWASKPFFVLEAIKRNIFSSKFFVWCDIGIMRTREHLKYYLNFPHYSRNIIAPKRIHFLEVERISDDLVQKYFHVSNTLQCIREIENETDIPSVMLGGGCIAGDRFAWEDFTRAYLETLRVMHKRKWFVGQDQRVFFAALMERRTTYPYRLFHATPAQESQVIDMWMSFPAFLGGSIKPRIDRRFEVKSVNKHSPGKRDWPLCKKVDGNKLMRDEGKSKDSNR